MKLLPRFFNSPGFYNLIQWILAPIGSLEIRGKLFEFSKNVNGRILDIGCGTGKYAGVFLDKEYSGVDIDEAYLDHARKKYPRGKFFQVSSIKLPFEDSYFNFVFSVSTFHHLTDEEVAISIAEMRRVCRPGGLMVVIDNIYPTGWNFLGYALFKLDRGRNQRTFQKMSYLMGRHGFSGAPFFGFPYEYSVFQASK